MKKALRVLWAFVGTIGAVLLCLAGFVATLWCFAWAGFAIEARWGVPMPFGAGLALLVTALLWAGLLAAWEEARS